MLFDIGVEGQTNKRFSFRIFDAKPPSCSSIRSVAFSMFPAAMSAFVTLQVINTFFPIPFCLTNADIALGDIVRASERMDEQDGAQHGVWERYQLGSGKEQGS